MVLGKDDYLESSAYPSMSVPKSFVFITSFDLTGVLFNSSSECDLASLASVQRAVKEFASASARVDVFMWNAGVKLARRVRTGGRNMA